MIEEAGYAARSVTIEVRLQIDLKWQQIILFAR